MSLPVPKPVFLLVVILTSLAKVHNSWGHGLMVPNRKFGFVYKPCDSCQPPITWSFYCDNTCPDCKRAFPTVLQAADRLGSDKVQLVFHPFSLPFHRNSHIVAKGTHVIHDLSNGSATYDWLKIVYDNLGLFTNTASANLTDGQVMDLLTEMASRVSGISPETFTSKFAEWQTEWKARHEWKYSCSRGVFYSPTFMVNDVLVDADQTWTVEQWTAFFGDLL